MLQTASNFLLSAVIHPFVKDNEISLFTQVYVCVTCLKRKAIMFSNKLETTYNSTRNTGKSRPPYDYIKRETKLRDLVSFPIAQSSLRNLQIVAAQANQPKHNRVPYLCLIPPIIFTESVTQKQIGRTWIFLACFPVCSIFSIPVLYSEIFTDP